MALEPAPVPEAASEGLLGIRKFNPHQCRDFSDYVPDWKSWRFYRDYTITQDDVDYFKPRSPSAEARLGTSLLHEDGRLNLLGLAPRFICEQRKCANPSCALPMWPMFGVMFVLRARRER